MAYKVMAVDIMKHPMNKKPIDAKATFVTILPEATIGPSSKRQMKYPI